MARTYADAIETLNSLQTNFSVIEAIRKSGRTLNKEAIPRMRHYLRRAGYEPSDLNALNAIHISGTKGKGSTSALTASILAQYTTPTPSHPNPPLRKIGLYTSPHLRSVRERIQIDGAPLSEALFAKYFFEVHDRLAVQPQAAPDPAALAPAAAFQHHHPDRRAPSSSSSSSSSNYPAYFSFLTLLAFHAFVREGVDAAVVECGIGGEHDATNVLARPAATGVTSLGIDHTALLGETVDAIAWHKAGIFKRGAPAFAVPQPAAAMPVLEARAQEAGTTLVAVPLHPEIEALPLALQGAFQKTNASLAAALAAAYLRARGLDVPLTTTSSSPSPLPAEFLAGLRAARWPGRCDARRDARVPNLVWNLDCGHTRESVTVAGEWFRARCRANLASPTPTPLQHDDDDDQPPRILLFNQQTRQAKPLLAALLDALGCPAVAGSPRGNPFSHVIFSSNRTFREDGFSPELVNRNVEPGAVDDLRVQREMARAWGVLVAGEEQEEEEGGGGGGEGGKVEVVGSLEEAVGLARGIGRAWGERRGSGEEGGLGSGGGDVQVLVVGSVHLVGGVMEVLEREAERESGGSGVSVGG